MPQIDAAARADLDEQQAGDQVTADHEEHLDAEEPAGQQRPVGPVVIQQHRDHRDRAQTVETRKVRQARAPVRAACARPAEGGSSRCAARGTRNVSVRATEHSSLYGSARTRASWPRRLFELSARDRHDRRGQRPTGERSEERLVGERRRSRRRKRPSGSRCRTAPFRRPDCSSAVRPSSRGTWRRRTRRSRRRTRPSSSHGSSVSEPGR